MHGDDIALTTLRAGPSPGRNAFGELQHAPVVCIGETSWYIAW